MSSAELIISVVHRFGFSGSVLRNSTCCWDSLPMSNVVDEASSRSKMEWCSKMPMCESSPVPPPPPFIMSSGPKWSGGRANSLSYSWSSSGSCSGSASSSSSTSSTTTMAERSSRPFSCSYFLSIARVGT
uniref:(northern house mosquito) hypothetical protein n=1 Tax=Culex pipiens TaxID=7175 RepID=A0A8D8CWW0_CULPI